MGERGIIDQSKWFKDTSDILGSRGSIGRGLDKFFATNDGQRW
jgi:hypothetical protein